MSLHVRGRGGATVDMRERHVPLHVRGEGVSLWTCNRNGLFTVGLSECGILAHTASHRHRCDMLPWQQNY